MIETYWSDDPETLLQKIHKSYLDRLDYINVPEEDQDRFIWSENKHINLYSFLCWSRHGSPVAITFAISSDSDHDSLIYNNIINKTHTFAFENIALSSRNSQEILQYFYGNNIIEKSLMSQIEKSSFRTNFYLSRDQFDNYLNSAIRDWVDDEYNSSQKSLAQNNITDTFSFSTQQIFIDRYHFNDMLEKISDEQFTSEFNECLFAYENQKWFLCSSGLGSNIEYLMLKTLQNYPQTFELLKGFPKDPTFANLKMAFRKPPIKINYRQETALNSLFMLRNSVDHYNTGYVSKRVCDMLLDGVVTIFNNYYLPSISKN